MIRGVCYSAYGAEAVKEAKASIASLSVSNPGLAVCVVSDDPKPFRQIAPILIPYPSDPFGRNAKLSMEKLSPFALSLYLDADTRIYGDLSLFFNALEDGFDFVATLSLNQGDKWLWHIEEDEREKVLSEIGFFSAQVQGGVWGFRKTDAVKDFFGEWRNLYAGAGEREQGRMQLAFHRKPMKTYFVGRDFNGGAIVSHRFGQARRKDVR